MRKKRYNSHNCTIMGRAYCGLISTAGGLNTGANNPVRSTVLHVFDPAKGDLK